MQERKLPIQSLQRSDVDKAEESSMASNKVWNLKYALGNTERIVNDASNPQSKQSALDGAQVVNRNGWRVWVEHNETGERIFESQREKDHKAATAA